MKNIDTAFPATRGYPIPEEIISFASEVRKEKLKSFSDHDRKNTLALLSAIKAGTKFVNGTLAAWLNAKVSSGETADVILMLRKQQGIELFVIPENILLFCLGQPPDIESTLIDNQDLMMGRKLCEVIDNERKHLDPCQEQDRELIDWIAAHIDMGEERLILACLWRQSTTEVEEEEMVLRS
jgi:hypothetical protein